MWSRMGLGRYMTDLCVLTHARSCFPSLPFHRRAQHGPYFALTALRAQASACTVRRDGLSFGYERQQSRFRPFSLGCLFSRGLCSICRPSVCSRHTLRTAGSTSVLRARTRTHALKPPRWASRFATTDFPSGPELLSPSSLPALDREYLPFLTPVRAGPVCSSTPQFGISSFDALSSSSANRFSALDH